MPKPLNAAESIKDVQKQISEEVAEMAKLQEEIRAHEAKALNLKLEIPKLQREIEVDKRQLYEAETSIPKLKSHLAEIQREKLGLQSQLTQVQKALQDGLRSQGIKLH